MIDILAFTHQKMREEGIEQYDTELNVIEVAAGSFREVVCPDDIHVLASFSSSNNDLSGKIVSATDAIELNQSVQGFDVAKHKLFRGSFRVTNLAAASTLYVEFVRITPIKCK